MTQKTRLLWDFRGPDAKPIAEHHAKHLDEFAKARQLSNTSCGIQERTPMLTSAYIVVETADAEAVINALRPHRRMEEE